MLNLVEINIKEFLLMQGIYKITNLKSNHAYIGKSTNIEQRWKDHQVRAFKQTKTLTKNGKPVKSEYDKALYIAIRKYGLKAFKFEVLEEIADSEKLDAREVYWINHYNTYYNGYNETPGGEGVKDQLGEKHPNHKLTQEDVICIRRRWAACKESVREIYADYNTFISWAGFIKIYSWQTWKTILPELYTTENRLWHKQKACEVFYSMPGTKNPNCKLTDAQVREIRQRKQAGEPVAQIYKDFSHLISLGGLRNIAGNYSYIRKDQL